MRSIGKFLLTLVLLLPITAPGLADGGGGSQRASPLAPFQEMIDDGKFDQAIGELKKALEESPDDPDIVNLIAYSHRQLEQFETALNYYMIALQLDPEHRGANEYLGELYLRLGQLGKAQERLQVLDDACFFGCDEYDMLEEAIEAYIKSNPA